jgi:hypothetical protein
MEQQPKEAIISKKKNPKEAIDRPFYPGFRQR